jgi:hypothetical protein
MKGNVPRGHGSCCGKYNPKIITSQYKNYDSMTRTFVGNQGISVKNTHASISTRFKWAKRGYPYSVVKSIKQTDCGSYTEQKARETICSNFAEAEVAQTIDTCEENNQNNQSNGDTTTPSCRKKVSLTIVKRTDTLSQSEYLKTKLLKKNCLPTPDEKKPYPIPISGPCSSSS